MTIEEAIQHCKEIISCEGDCSCAMEHKQLLKWLEELVELRKLLRKEIKE